MPYSYVRIGALSEVHLAHCPLNLPRGRRVIARTSRGTELAEIIRCLSDPATKNGSPSQETADHPIHREPTASILRPTTNEDELLLRRLERHKREAVEACQAALAESESQSVLLDVDQLFDGGTLVMHFLGGVDSLAESITREITERYESIVRTRHFSKLLSDGCGPNCGEKDGECGTACGGCSIANACKKPQ
ncbi:MAG: hypothetical protein CMM01_06305 [Rhodopirellula sp.]|nr:hypothetical protein [Rhodopirellula sp.]